MRQSSLEVFQNAVSAAVRELPGFQHFCPDNLEVIPQDQLTENAFVRTYKARDKVQHNIEACGSVQKLRGKSDWLQGDFTLEINGASHIFLFNVRPDGEIRLESFNPSPQRAA